MVRFGHFARECREEEDRCYKCHGMTSCFWILQYCAGKRKKTKVSSCIIFFAGTGHIARNCSQDEDTCYNCNEVLLQNILVAEKRTIGHASSWLTRMLHRWVTLWRTAPMRGQRLATSAAVLATSQGSAPGGYLATLNRAQITCVWLYLIFDL